MTLKLVEIFNDKYKPLYQVQERDGKSINGVRERFEILCERMALFLVSSNSFFSFVVRREYIHISIICVLIFIIHRRTRIHRRGIIYGLRLVFARIMIKT